MVVAGIIVQPEISILLLTLRVVYGYPKSTLMVEWISKNLDSIRFYIRLINFVLKKNHPMILTGYSINIRSRK